MTTNQHFKTQAEIQRYLLGEEGRRVVRDYDYTIVGYKDGLLWNFTDNRRAAHWFDMPEIWQPYEPKPWHEGVAPRTVLCWFWLNDANDTRVIDTLDYYEDGVYFMSNHSGGVTDCRPLTPEEVMKFHEAAVRVRG